MKQEKILRESVRKALGIYFKRNNNALIDNLIEETRLRKYVRNLLVEAATEDPTVDVHENTGINTLKALLKNTNVLTTLREVYKTLTTNNSQRTSFRAHIIKWITDTLAPIRLNDKAPLEEQIDIDIETGPDDAEKLIDADDGEPQPEPEPEESEGEEENNMTPIEGEDATGRNKAERVYPTIEKSIIDYYAELDNEEDQEMFYDYLIANMKLYFDKWESEMTSVVDEPTNDEYESAGQDSAPDPVADAPEGAPEAPAEDPLAGL